MEEIGLVAVFDVSRFNRGLDQYTSGVDEATKVTENAEKSGFSFARAFEVAVGNTLSFIATTVIPQVIGAFTNLATTVISDAISFESAWAGVTKTTDGLVDSTGYLTEAGYDLQTQFRELAKEVPIAIEELLGIGEIGGQLGIQQENLIGFTETVAALGETTNLSTEAAAVGLAQMSNVMGTSQDEISNLGSALVFLGNNSATTERDILNFAQRIAGAGQIAGLTEGDVLGIGAAFSSIGVSAEAGGTAVQKVILAMNQSVLTGNGSLETFAQTAGLSAEEFSTVWEEDAAGAFNMFVGGLGEAGDEAFGILEELELKDQRLIQAFLSLSQNSDLLTESMDGANMAFEENTALAAEAEQRYGTTASQFQVFKNNIRDVGIEMGSALLPAINEFTSALIPIIQQYGPQLSNLFTEIGELALNLTDSFTKFTSGDLEGGFEGLGVSFDFVKQVFENLKTSVNAVANFFMTSVMPRIQSFIDKMMPAFEMFVEQATMVFEALKANLEPIFNGIQNIFLGVLDFFSGWIEIVTGLYTQDFALMWEGVKTMLSGVWEFVIGVIESSIAIIASLMGTTVDELKTTVNQIVAIIFAVLKNASDVATQLVAIVFGILTTASTAATQLVAIGLAILKKASDTATQIVAIVFAALTTASMKIREFVFNTIERFNEFRQQIVDELEQFKTSSINKIQDFVQKAQEFFTKMKEKALSSINSFVSDAIEAIEELKNGIINKIKDIPDIVTGIFDNIKTFLQNINLADVGRNIIQGLADGISSAASIVTDAIKGAIDGAINAAKDALGIQSPSKVFASIGLDTMLGMGQGVNAGAMVPEQAVSNVVNNMTTQAGTTINNTNINNISNSVNFSGGGTSSQRSTYFNVLSAMEAVG